MPLNQVALSRRFKASQLQVSAKLAHLKNTITLTSSNLSKPSPKPQTQRTSPTNYLNPPFTLLGLRSCTYTHLPPPSPTPPSPSPPTTITHHGPLLKLQPPIPATRHLQALRQRQSRTATIHRQRIAKGPHPTMYVPHSLFPSAFLAFPNPYLLTTPADATWAETAVHALTDICWRKCVTGRISSGNLDRGEENCTANCVDRFMDANMTVLKHLEELRGQGGV